MDNINNLNVQNINGKLLADSRDVAKAIEQEHRVLLKTIRKYAECMVSPEGNEHHLALVDYFIESSYKDAKGEMRPCYLITEQGCEMIANKLTGQKGILFTAVYVRDFHHMKEALNGPAPRPAPGVSPGALASLLNTYERQMKNAGKSPSEICAVSISVSAQFGVYLPVAYTKEIPGQLCMFDAPLLRLEAG